MAHHAGFAYTPLTLSRPAARDLSLANPGGAPRVAKAGAVILLRIALGIGFVILGCAAVVYPLSSTGGYLARAKGDIVALDPSAQTLSYQDNGLIARVQLSDATSVYLNGRPVALDGLQTGDRVLVKYDSVLKLTALEIHALRRHP